MFPLFFLAFFLLAVHTQAVYYIVNSHSCCVPGEGKIRTHILPKGKNGLYVERYIGNGKQKKRQVKSSR
jgi:hypothetical protein